eukprot:5099117-Pleurochrysis_carterae.AAC.1
MEHHAFCACVARAAVRSPAVLVSLRSARTVACSQVLVVIEHGNEGSKALLLERRTGGLRSRAVACMP